MSTPAKINYKMYQGSTFAEVLRWESSTKNYVTITNITKSAPVVITTEAHTIPDNWRVRVTNVGGMKEINDSESYRVATVLTNTSIELNSVNALGYTAYTSGGVLEYNEPVALNNYTARMQIREKIDTPVLYELTTENDGIILNTADSTINLNIPAAITEAFTFKKAVYSIELINASNDSVTTFVQGNITLYNEVTR